MSRPLFYASNLIGYKSGHVSLLERAPTYIATADLLVERKVGGTKFE